MTTKTETIEVLRRARGYVERGWTQGSEGRDENGARVLPHDPSATCWCVYGAIDRASSSGEDAVDAFAKVIDTPYVARWNDAPGRTQAEVLAAFDRAIALVEAEG